MKSREALVSGIILSAEVSLGAKVRQGKPW